MLQAFETAAVHPFNVRLGQCIVGVSLPAARSASAPAVAARPQSTVYTPASDDEEEEAAHPVPCYKVPERQLSPGLPPRRPSAGTLPAAAAVTPSDIEDLSVLWKFPSMSPADAGDLLREKPPGTFVVHGNGAGGVQLMVRAPPDTQQLGISKQAGGYMLDGVPDVFPTLSMLLAHTFNNHMACGLSIQPTLPTRIAMAPQDTAAEHGIELYASINEYCTEPWFVGDDVPPDACEKAVLAARDGDFLVRPSASRGAQSFVLVVHNNAEAINFALEVDEDRGTCKLGAVVLASIEELVAAHREIPLTNPSSHQPILLKRSATEYLDRSNAEKSAWVGRNYVDWTIAPPVAAATATVAEPRAEPVVKRERFSRAKSFFLRRLSSAPSSAPVSAPVPVPVPASSSYSHITPADAAPGRRATVTDADGGGSYDRIKPNEAQPTRRATISATIGSRPQSASGRPMSRSSTVRRGVVESVAEARVILEATQGEWHRPSFSRDEATAYLVTQLRPGAFVVRSSSNPEKLALSVLKNDRTVYNGLISKASGFKVNNVAMEPKSTLLELMACVCTDRELCSAANIPVKPCVPLQLSSTAFGSPP